MARFVIAGQFFFPQGGAPGSRVRNLALGLAESGAQVDVIPAALRGTNVPPGAVVELAAGVRFHAPIDRAAILAEPSLRNETLQARVAWIWREVRRFQDVRRRVQRLGLGRGDVLVLYGRSYTRLSPLYHEARRRGAAIVWDVVETPNGFRGFGGRFNPLYWDARQGFRIARHADVVTTITTGLASMFAGARRTHLLPTLLSWPANPPGVSASAPSSPEFRVLYVGGLLEKDDPATLLSAVRIAGSRGLNIRLVVAGHISGSSDGRARRAEIAADPQLAHVMELHESPDDVTLGRLRSSADAFVTLRPNLPSEVLSFPTRVVEHLQHARPLVTTALGDLPLYLRDGEDALLVRPGDAAGVADAFERLSRDRAFAGTLGTQGWHAGRRHFDRSRHASALMQVIEELATREIRSA